MDDKFLNCDSSSVSYEELTAYVNELIPLEQFKTIQSLFIKHLAVFLGKKEEYTATAQLLYRILNKISNSTNDFGPIRSYFVNLAGLLSANLDLGKESLYLYLLALLAGDRDNRALYYNNVGSSLANLKNFELANTFYTKGLSFIDTFFETKGDKAFSTLNLTYLNQSISYIQLGEHEKAIERYEKVDTDQLDFFNVDYAYKFVGWYLRLIKIEDLKEASRYLKELEEKSNTLGFLLRRHVINHLPMSSDEKYTLWKENYALLPGTFGKRERIECLTSLIVLAKELQEKEDETRFLNHLLETNLETNEYEHITSKIIVEQYVEFFNKLMRTNVQIKHQKDELQKLTYILSHNLKTPIRNIYGFSQLLKDKYSNALDQEADEYLKFIENGCNELYELLNNILHIANYNEKKESESVVCLDEIIDQIDEKLRVTNKIEFKIIKKGRLPKIWARKSDIKELFEIMIENGVKFNNSEIPIISFEYPQKDTMDNKLKKETFQLIVSDNGIGIDTFGKSKIFDLFTKLENKAIYSGTGFGLGMAKKIVDYYNGSILLKQTGNNGSVFHIEFPQNLIVVEEATQANYN